MYDVRTGKHSLEIANSLTEREKEGEEEWQSEIHTNIW